MQNIQAFIKAFGALITHATQIGASLGLLVFLWGLAKFIFNKEPSGITEGKDRMIWGVIALFVMFSVWGLVALMQSELLGDVQPGYQQQQGYKPCETAQPGETCF